MAVAQGIKKQIAYKLQGSGLGSAESGSGGQLIRRETASFNITKDTYTSNEIVSHQQHTGDTHGVRSSSATLAGLLSPLSYKDFFSSLLRKAWAGTSNLTGLSVTIAGSNPYTITRGSGDFLTGGIKVGDVVRLSGGSLAVGNVGKNLLVTAVTATVVTVIPLAGSTLTAEGPIASVTMSVPGQKVWAPTSGHTNDYYTFEEWFSDISRSHVYQDIQIGSAEISVPATGNVGVNFNLVGLGYRSESGAQVLTSPTAETTSSIVSSVSGAVLVNGTQYGSITSANVTIDGQITAGEPVIGSNFRPDNQRGRIRVSGSFTALYESDTLGTPFVNETAVPLVLVLQDENTTTADFVTLVMSKVKLFSDDADDGEKQILRTYSFVAELNGDGGAALANHQTIISMQDSLVS